jgi:hypothetical protein
MGRMRKSQDNLTGGFNVKTLWKFLEGVETAVPNDRMIRNGRSEESDQVVGVLPEELKRLYAFYFNSVQKSNEEIDRLRQRYGGVVEAASKNRNAAVIEKAKKLARRRHALIHSELDLLFDIFTLEVREVFTKIDVGQEFALRTGWKVVIPNGKCQTCPSRFGCPFPMLDTATGSSALSSLFATILGGE